MPHAPSPAPPAGDGAPSAAAAAATSPPAPSSLPEDHFPPPGSRSASPIPGDRHRDAHPASKPRGAPRSREPSRPLGPARTYSPEQPAPPRPVPHRRGTCEGMDLRRRASSLHPCYPGPVDSTCQVRATARCCSPASAPRGGERKLPDLCPARPGAAPLLPHLDTSGGSSLRLLVPGLLLSLSNHQAPRHSHPSFPGFGLAKPPETPDAGRRVAASQAPKKPVSRPPPPPPAPSRARRTGPPPPSPRRTNRAPPSPAPFSHPPHPLRVHEHRTAPRPPQCRRRRRRCAVVPRPVASVTPFPPHTTQSPAVGAYVISF
jgi:hypothetical protein